MKKLISLVSAVALFAFASSAATVSVTVTGAGAMVAPVGLTNAIGVLNWVSVTAPSVAPTLKIVDTYTNSTTWTNNNFIGVVSYPTNCITTWTNYYGATNSLTNICLVDVTNTVTGTTNNFAVLLAPSVPASTTVLYQNLHARFEYGLWFTNSAASGGATVTLNYTPAQ